MKNLLEKNMIVLTSMCDAEGRLGIANVFDICMDLAAEHAAQLGVSYYDMLERRCYWVAVRTRVKLYNRPMLGEKIRLETWPYKPGLAKSERFYRIGGVDSVMAEGRTEWAAMDIDTGAVRRTDSYGYPTSLQHHEERVCEEPFTRFRKQVAEEPDDRISYIVGSQDIDVGRHMNNVAYIRMLLGTFHTSELSSMDISEVEISYGLACYEGEQLLIFRHRKDDAWCFRVEKPNGDTAVNALFRMRT